jgi:hypothetical protein
MDFLSLSDRVLGYWRNGVFGVARFEFRVAGQERKQRKRATRNPQHVTSKFDKRIIL